MTQCLMCVLQVLNKLSLIIQAIKTSKTSKTSSVFLAIIFIYCISKGAVISFLRASQQFKVHCWGSCRQLQTAADSCVQVSFALIALYASPNHVASTPRESVCAQMRFWIFITLATRFGLQIGDLHVTGSWVKHNQLGCSIKTFPPQIHYNFTC